VAGAQVVIDLTNSPSFEDRAVLEFFETSGRNLLAAEAAAGVRHHVALSIVGTDRSDNGYFRAKIAHDPGGFSPGHTHAKSAFIYAIVLDGAFPSQAKGQLSGLNAPDIGGRRPK
jgi:quercetin dioxygenase-like cupin family protein